MTPLSILELARITQGVDARGALDNARDLAAHAENWGYRRLWVAEHHNMPGIASAATSIVIAHIAAGSKRIRVGAGGVMLQIMPPMSSPNSSAPWSACSRAASILDWAVRREPTR